MLVLVFLLYLMGGLVFVLILSLMIAIVLQQKAWKRTRTSSLALVSTGARSRWRFVLEGARRGW